MEEIYKDLNIELDKLNFDCFSRNNINYKLLLYWVSDYKTLWYLCNLTLSCKGNFCMYCNISYSSRTMTFTHHIKREHCNFFLLNTLLHLIRSFPMFYIWIAVDLNNYLQ